jgi:hypothetical protein
MSILPTVWQGDGGGDTPSWRRCISERTERQPRDQQQSARAAHLGLEDIEQRILRGAGEVDLQRE